MREAEARSPRNAARWPRPRNSRPDDAPTGSASLDAPLRLSRPAQDEKLPKLRKPVAQPAPVALREADHRRGHRDELVGLQIHERCGLRFAHPRRREKERCGNPEDGREAREYGGAWLLDATRFELGDGRARDTNSARQLRLSEMQFFARGPDRERQRRP